MIAIRAWVGSLLLLALAGCITVPSVQQRADTAQALAGAAGWQGLTIASTEFDLAAWVQPGTASTLWVYIEGDGLAWLASDLPSSDPTPVQPIALQLALAQPTGQAAYLARPCQYVRGEHCNQHAWTDARFSLAAVAAMSHALDELRQHAGAQRLILVGYSGGAALALLLAERRDDIAAIVSVAGNLDPMAWVRLQRLSPLTGSLDPMAHAQRLHNIPQLHYVGSADTVVPQALTQQAIGALPGAEVRAVSGNDHNCCWVRQWPGLWRDAATNFSAANR